MTDREKKIILDYACGSISNEQLFKMLPEYNDDEYLLKKYTEAYEKKDRELLEYIRMVPIKDVNKLLPIYQKLIIEDWHIESEDMIGYFQQTFNKDKKSIPYLEKCIRNIPRYLQFGDMKYPYIKKVIYAIGAQPEPYNLQALEELCKMDDPQIKELALHQIKKRKQLGRWETDNEKSR